MRWWWAVEGLCVAWCVPTLVSPVLTPLQKWCTVLSRKCEISSIFSLGLETSLGVILVSSSGLVSAAGEGGNGLDQVIAVPSSEVTGHWITVNTNDLLSAAPEQTVRSLLRWGSNFYVMAQSNDHENVLGFNWSHDLFLRKRQADWSATECWVWGRLAKIPVQFV